MLFNKKSDKSERDPFRYENEELARYFKGALGYVSCDTGMVQPCRFFSKQLRFYDSVGRLFRACATSGVMLNFTTTASYVLFDYEVVRYLDSEHKLYKAVMSKNGGLGVAEDGVIDGLDVLINDTVLFTYPVKSGSCEIDLHNEQHDIIEVKIYLPYLMSIACGSLTADTKLEPVGAKPSLLVLGDSISQGMFAGNPASCYAMKLARMLDMDLCNQSVAGITFDRRSLRGLYNLKHNSPACILVALGTNDWELKDSAGKIKSEIIHYFRRLNSLFPEVQVFVLSPIWRADIDQLMPCNRPLDWVRDTIREVIGEYENMHYVDGSDVVLHSTNTFADGILHPNSFAQNMMADTLYQYIMMHSN